MPHSTRFPYYRVGSFEMRGRKEMSMAFERMAAPRTGRPVEPEADRAEHQLEVAVVFTSAAATIAALRKAGALADRLRARITLVVPQVVPRPLPLESPPVLLDFSEKRFAEIANESSVETIVRLYLCRDQFETLKAVLRPHSLVVIGGRKRWWPTRERYLARRLRREGHDVI